MFSRIDKAFERSENYCLGFVPPHNSGLRGLTGSRQTLSCEATRMKEVAMEHNALGAPSGYCYWTSRLIEAERQYMSAANSDLMNVYAELMKHYENMAKLHAPDRSRDMAWRPQANVL